MLITGPSFNAIESVLSVCQAPSPRSQKDTKRKMKGHVSQCETCPFCFLPHDKAQCIMGSSQAALYINKMKTIVVSTSSKT